MITYDSRNWFAALALHRSDTVRKLLAQERAKPANNKSALRLPPLLGGAAAPGFLCAGSGVCLGAGRVSLARPQLAVAAATAGG